MPEEFSYIWEGIYDEFPKSESNPIWDSDRWVTSEFEPISAADLKQDPVVANLSPLSLVHEYPLPPVVAMLTQSEPGLPVRILDFGGGGGSSFLACVNSLPDSHEIEFHIVEGKAICKKGLDAYHGFKNIFFHESLPSPITNFDVVHVAAALHYVRDWRSLVKQLLSYHPKILMLNALNAGSIQKTFASFQNYYGEKIPVWFWNIREIVDFLSSMRYKLIYKSLMEFSFLGKIQPLPMDNFPPEFRLNRKCNLMFVPER